MIKAFTQNKPIFALIFLAFILVGISFSAYAVYSYLDAQNGIEDNTFYQQKESGEPIDIPDRPTMSSLALELYNSQVEYNDLVHQRGLALRYLGIGLALVGFGWLGADFTHSRFIKTHSTASEPTV